MISLERKNSIWSYFFLSLLLVYALKNVAYPAGSISKGIALVEIIFCSVFFLKTILLKRRPNDITILIMLSTYILCSFLLSKKSVHSSFAGNLNTFTFFREYVGGVFPIFPAFILAFKNKLNRKLLLYFFICYFTISIFVFFVETISLYQSVTYADEVTSNYAYSFVYLTPFLGLFKNKIKTIPFWIIAFGLAFMSAKRGVILGLSVQFLIFYITLYKTSNHKYWHIFILLIFLIIASNELIDYYNSDFLFQSRVEATLEGKTSGRDVIVDKILSSFIKSYVLQYLLGHGFASTVDAAGNYAHNDWVEMLYDFGIIIFIIYVLYYYYAYKSVKTLKNSFRLSSIMAVTSLFLSAFFSMSFFSNSSCTSFLLLGYIWGNNYRVKSFKIKANGKPTIDTI